MISNYWARRRRDFQIYPPMPAAAPRYVIVFDNGQSEPAMQPSIHDTLARAKARNLGAELREGDRVLIVARRVASEASGWLAYYTLEGQTGM